MQREKHSSTALETPARSLSQQVLKATAVDTKKKSRKESGLNVRLAVFSCRCSMSF